MRRDLNADVTVITVREVIHWTKNVGGHLQILDLDPLEESVRIHIGRAAQNGANCRIVFAIASQGLGENCGITGDACDAVFLDQPLKPSASDQVSADVVKPDRLAGGGELAEGIHCAVSSVDLVG